MNKKLKTYKQTINKPRLIIGYDSCPESPRQWDNLGYFIVVSNNYESPDENYLKDVVKDTGQEATSLEDHIKMIKKAVKLEGETVEYITPINCYEHGQINYSRGTKHGFDYSNNGFYIVTKESRAKLGTPKNKTEAIIDSELEDYNKYANGYIYAFRLYNPEGEPEDSCGGFYDIEDIRDYLPKEWKNENLEDYLVSEAL